MLKLLTCTRGHFWEAAVERPQDAPACPECGGPADDLPLLDLAPEAVAAAPPAPPLPTPLFDDSGRPNVGGYEIVEDLGRSPARVRLYRARQAGIGRDVLLEVVAAKEDAGQHAWTALRGQASALGKLSHANVVQVHDVGERDRQVFYNAVEFVEGPTLAQKVAEKPLPVPQVMRLVELLARAVDHAHSRGVLHRNLRPSCVLLQQAETSKKELEGDPAGVVCLLHSKAYVPKLTGFGLARKPAEGEAIDADLFGDELGYSSPEQVWGRAKDLGPNTDVYGLGGVLYFLLTGRAPFEGPSVPEVYDAIQTAELKSPSSARRVPADLENVCRRALARSPRRRYASAAEMADDLRRVQLGQALDTGKTTAARRLGGFVRRRPMTTLLLLALAASVVGMFVAYAKGASEGSLDGSKERAYLDTINRLQADANRARGTGAHAARVQGFLSYRQRLARAEAALAQGDRPSAQALLGNVAEADRGVEWFHAWQRAAGRDEAAFEGIDEEVKSMAYSRDGRSLLTAHDRAGENRGRVRLWRRNQGRPWGEVRRIDDFDRPILALAYSPDGRHFAVTGRDGADDGALYLYNAQGARLWHHDLSTEQQNQKGNTPTDVGFTPSGDRVVFVRDDGTMGARNVAGNFTTVERFGISVGRFDRAQKSRLAVGASHALTFTSGQSVARVYRLDSWQWNEPFSGNQQLDAVALVDASEDMRPFTRLALARADQSVTVRDLSTNEEARLTDLPARVTRLAFGPDGRRLAVGFGDGGVRVWANAGGVWVEVMATAVGTQPVVGLGFGNGGRSLAAAGGRKVVVWGQSE